MSLGEQTLEGHVAPEGDVQRRRPNPDASDTFPDTFVYGQGWIRADSHRAVSRSAGRKRTALDPRLASYESPTTAICRHTVSESHTSAASDDKGSSP